MTRNQTVTVNWNDYAQTYDLMATHNPAYQDLLRRFSGVASTWQMNKEASILEVGAGTGNFALCAASIHGNARVIHSEPSSAMQLHARHKADSQGLENLHFVLGSAEELELADQSISAAILVHMLYTLSDPKEFLGKLHQWLVPGAPVFACDFGRRMDVSDWRRYLVGEMRHTIGWRRTLLTLWRGRGIARANHHIATEQLRGRYWMHTTEEFAAAFRETGFKVVQQEVAYRGYSDIVVACRI